MSESDTMFNEQDRRCAAVQLMLSTAPSYDSQNHRWIAMNNRDVPRVMKTMFPATLCHLTSSKSAWKSTPKCTWMCWRVWLSPGAIRWPVADPGCGSRLSASSQVQRGPGLASEGVLQLCTLLSLAPSSLDPLNHFVWSYVKNITNMTSHNTKASLITAIRRVFTELPPVLVEKACSQFRIHIEAVIEIEGGYIE